MLLLFKVGSFFSDQTNYLKPDGVQPFGVVLSIGDNINESSSLLVLLKEFATKKQTVIGDIKCRKKGMSYQTSNLTS
jgi:hypothetical protein